MRLSEINGYLGSIVNVLYEYAHGHVVSTKELPQTIRAVLKKLGHHRREISVVPQDRVVLSSAGAKGERAFAAVVDVATGKNEITYGSWGGPNMFTTNAVDSDHKPYSIPQNGAVILGSEGGGRPVYATIYVNPQMIAGFLPTEEDQVTPRERRILAIFRAYKPDARKGELDYINANQSEIDDLIRRGHLTKTVKGGLTLSSMGKRASSHR